VVEAGGRVFGSEGDALFASFSNASSAILAAAEAQRALDRHSWPADADVRVRMGIHSGSALDTGEDFVGLPLHQAARITSAAHGGMVLVSEAARQLAGPLPADLQLRDLGARRLKDLAWPERLYQLAGSGLRDGFPPLRTLDARPNNLPVQLTSFVGREELQAARSALDSSRLLTLTGPGGTGKTRLSLQLAADASEDFPDGVFFVALDSLRDPALVPSTIAASIGLRERDAPPLESLIEYLRDKHALLVLDNMEQIVQAGGVVARLLRELRELKIIVTSRIVLRVYGEQEFQVPPLGLPSAARAKTSAEEAARSEAVRLFVERAMAATPTFRLTDENAATVIDICRRLDGLPLAIELAAARTRILSVEQLRARLDRSLRLLTGGARDLPARQQTLRGAIEWSHALLSEPDRRLFLRFAVFAGGAFLNEAEVVCGPPEELSQDVLEGLSSLADNSLMRSMPAGHEDPRFAMLATIREYAHERMVEAGEAEEMTRRHALTYLQVVEGLADQLTGLQSRPALDRLEVDHDNLRLALDWAVARGDAGFALRFIVAIWRFWQRRGHLYEARQSVDAVTAMAGVDDQPALLKARAFAAAGGICYWQADLKQTHRHYRRALEEAERSGDERARAQALYDFGFAPLDEDQPSYDDVYRAGRGAWDESLRIFRQLGDEQGIANASWALSMAVAPSDLAAASRHAQDSLTMYRRLGDPFGTAWAAFQLALYSAIAGGNDEAKPLLDEAVELFRASDDQSGIGLGLATYAWLAERQGDLERAARLGGAALALAEATGVRLAHA
ncbi:MAG: adenylate/guanylate cyclase domain-containing protein, partial [Chloroflexota bacterium]|nr:adenylate/guanylate cyclase domain-containing protein [Chloroflexota bacterium]